MHSVRTFCDNILWQYFVTTFCDNILWQHSATTFCNNTLWQDFVTTFCDNILWQHSVTTFCNNTLWQDFVTTGHLSLSFLHLLAVEIFLHCGQNTTQCDKTSWRHTLTNGVVYKGNDEGKHGNATEWYNAATWKNLDVTIVHFLSLCPAKVLRWYVSTDSRLGL